MKKFVFLILFLFCGAVFAEEEVLLDINPSDFTRFNTGTLDFNNTSSIDDEEDIKDYLKPSLNSMKKMFDEDFYEPKNISSKKEKKLGKTTIGAKADYKLNPNEVTGTRTLYSKHDLTQKVSVGTSYKTKSSADFNDQTKGTVSVAPEYRFTEKTSLQNIYSSDLNDNSKKTELKLKYKPFKDDRTDLNMGVGQKTYDNGQQSSSQINFGTNFRF